MDKGLSSCAIFLDLAKAFDSVDHNILLRKLEHYGIRGGPLEMFKSYLTERSQFVKLGSTTSTLIDIMFGVPQGSILGPLLFLIFINDLPNATNLYIKLFADDTFLCAQDNDLSTLESNINAELDKVFVWLASNKLTLNIKKSKYMMITKKRSIPSINIMINDSNLDQCDSYKYLGVYIDKNLSWRDHIDYTCTKVSKACGALAKIRHCVDFETLRNVYHALLYSYLRYGIIAWGNASKTLLKPLETLVNKAIRIMAFIPKGNFNISQVYKDLKLLELSKIHQLETGKFMFKTENMMLPTSLGNYFKIDRCAEEHSYSTRNRSSTSNHPPRIICRTKSGEKSIQYVGSKLWFKLPSELKSSESLISFKCQYKSYLLGI